MQAILVRARELELANKGLTTDQAMILFTVKTSAEPVTLGDVARMMHKAPRTLSALVRRMEVNGLLKTSRDLKRRNRVRVSLTKSGEEAYYSWLSATGVPNGVWACLSREELDMLRTITRKLRDKGIELLQQMESDTYDEPLFW
jgi:DNA-binding MarR family transcriptional regulator